MNKRGFWWVSCIVAVGVLAAVGVVHHHATYPYGSSHCCIIQMSGALEMYAEENGGRYPAGQSSPEACLSLLCRSNYANAYLLRGMTVPEATVRRILESGGQLGPDSCGWHYVPGLTKADDRKLALVWCKEPLGHNGERTKDGGRQVVFVGGDIEWISGAKWPAFLEEQKALLAHRSQASQSGAPLVTGVIELPDGTRLDRTDAYCTVQEESRDVNLSSHGTSSGGLELVWYHAPVQNGYVTRTLSFSNLISDPVTVTFTNGVPDVTNYVFKMKSR